MVYWIAVTSSWLPFAYSVLGARAAGWGMLMVGAGLMVWFTALILFVRFVPHRADAILFRAANATLGLILLGFGAYCSVDLSRRLLHLSLKLVIAVTLSCACRSYDGSRADGEWPGWQAALFGVLMAKPAPELRRAGLHNMNLKIEVHIL